MKLKLLFTLGNFKIKLKPLRADIKLDSVVKLASIRKLRINIRKLPKKQLTKFYKNYLHQSKLHCSFVLMKGINIKRSLILYGRDIVHSLIFKPPNQKSYPMVFYSMNTPINLSYKIMVAIKIQSRQNRTINIGPLG